MDHARTAILEDGGERLLGLFDALPAAVAVMRGRDHTFEYVNSGYLDVVSRPLQDLIGRPLAEAMPEIAEQGFGALIDQVMDSGEPYYGVEVPIEIARLEGGALDQAYFDFVYVPVTDTAGVIDGVLAHGHEVTASVRARQQIEQLARDLEVQHDSLENVLEQLPAGVVICDASGNITHANSQWREFFQMPIANFNDVDSWVAFEGVRGDGTRYEADEYPLARSILHGEKIFGEQITFRVDGGPERTIEVNSSPIHDNEGNVARGVAVFSDVTERLALHSELAERRERSRAQARFERVLEAAGDGIWVLDAQGRTTMMNQAAQELTGYTFAELEGRHSHPIIHHSHRDGSPYPMEECPIYASVHAGTACDVDDEVFWRKDGTSFPVAYRSTPIFDGDEQIGAVQVFRDLTEQRRAEAEQQRARDAIASQHQALQLNDDVLQGLTATKLAMELQDTTFAIECLDEAISSMRGIINELLERSGSSLAPGELVRSEAPHLPGWEGTR